MQNYNHGLSISAMGSRSQSSSFHNHFRCAFSSTTALAARTSDTKDGSSPSSPSATSLSPLALSIGEALEGLVKKQNALRNQNQLSISQQDEITVTSQDSAARQKFILVLSVSGGCDSVALLHATMELQNSLGLLPKNSGSNWELECHVMHFHHRQRDVEADLDCQLVQELAEEQYQIPFLLQDWNEEMKLSKEDADAPKFSQNRARRWRRQRLLEYTQSLLLLDSKRAQAVVTKDNNISPIGVILTAHHRNDSEESLLLKLLRGVHILNLSGMEAITTLDHGGNSEANGGDSGNDAQTSNIYVLRPWLKQRKEDLQDYLMSKNKTWREDASNASPKYLRNRVRNELIPLMEELSPSIHKRLEILEQQSFELQQELEPQILDYLDRRQVVVDGTPQSERQFIWETDEVARASSPLLQSQALFRWMQEEVERRHCHDEMSSNNGNRSTSLSYDMLQRVLHQLRHHPNELDWIMDLGGKFRLQRKGARLKIITMSPEQGDDSTNPKVKSGCPWTWSMAPENDKARDSVLRLAIPAEVITSDLQFLETTVEEYAKMPNALLRFRPQWKPTESRPIKLRQFLRGQQVPLHERDTTPILYMATNTAAATAAATTTTTNNIASDSTNIQSNETKIVAVHVNGSWMVHGDFSNNNDGFVNKSGMLMLHVEHSEGGR
ncbi:unnamed protein product [Cylindrotheca closterium]|uniref:tRNA(Ile)-lysidine synthetase n=1 Tax=Cylindrotheca closterium TaxID=2856 RepID=A0AAD2CMS7_9STRA|nr:unnamed protein product [Cylindrotheca closterium]